MTQEPNSPPPAEEPLIDYPFVHEEADQPRPLSSRLRDPRTIISIVLPVLLVVLIAATVGNIDFAELVGHIAQANLLLLVAAFAIYYVGFPLRGYRWKTRPSGTGTNISVRDSTEIRSSIKLAGQLPRAGQAGRRRSLLAAAAQLHSLA